MLRTRPGLSRQLPGLVLPLLLVFASCVPDPAAESLAATTGKPPEEQAAFIMSLYERDDPGVGEAFRALQRDSPEHGVRAYAAYVYAFWLMKDDSRDPEETLGAFEAILRDYSEVPHPKNGTPLGDEPSLAEALVVTRAAVRLAVGKTAPEIEGTDLDGALLRLSDYRGRVVMLDFWAHWCGGCVEMLPYEIELVERLAEAPFALLGVNGDPDIQEVRTRNAEQRITWKSFWNGPGGAEGPITDAWPPRGWPTIYLIDHHGVIRHKQVGRPGVDGNPGYRAFDDLIDRLVAEARTDERL